jgi:hypothetical protein
MGFKELCFGVSQNCAQGTKCPVFSEVISDNAHKYFDFPMVSQNIGFGVGPASNRKE